MSELYSLWVRVAEIAPRPMSAPPPSPQKAMTLMGSAFILPFVMSALRPAAVPSAAEPEEPSCVCIHGTTQYVVLATYMQPVAPRTMVRGPAALTMSFITSADSQPWQVRWPEVKYSSRVTFLTPRNGSRICVALVNVVVSAMGMLSYSRTPSQCVFASDFPALAAP